MFNPCSKDLMPKKTITKKVHEMSIVQNKYLTYCVTNTVIQKSIILNILNNLNLDNTQKQGNKTQIAKHLELYQ